MSVGTYFRPEQAASPSSSATPANGHRGDTDLTSRTEHASPHAKTDSSSESESKDSDSDSTQINITSSLFASLWSPISSLLQTSSSPSPSPSTPSSEQSKESPSTPSIIQEVEKEPEPYYTPDSVPLFKTLQKTRLSGTRTKQLLRAASRGYNDPPPPPDLGSCCGSSCDPCVNDLWREERDVWRGRWGDRRVEGGSDLKQGTEGDGKGEGGDGGKRKKMKDLEW